jgi:hypothetical protein
VWQAVGLLRPGDPGCKYGADFFSFPICFAALPAGVETVLVAPDNAAFEALLGKLGLSFDELAANPDAVATVLSVHVAVAQGGGATQADTVSGNKIRFINNGASVPLNTINSTEGSTLEIQGPMNKAPVTGVVDCGNRLKVFTVSSVLEPKPEDLNLGGDVAAVPETAPVPETAVEPAVVPLPDLLIPEVVETPVVAPEPEVVPVVVPSPEPAVIPSPSPSPSPYPTPSPTPGTPYPEPAPPLSGAKALVAGAAAVATMAVAALF